MIGHIFFLLQKFVQKEYGPAVWARLFAEAGIAPKMYLLMANYPDEEAVMLVQAAAQLTDRSVPGLLESFGEALAPDLLGLFRSLVQPEWKTLDLIENVESIHTVIRKQNPEAKPPVLQCLRLSETELELVYTSHRQLCALAKGVIRGVAAYYDEHVEVVEHTCMNQGDRFCTFQIVALPLAVPAFDAGFEEAATQLTPAGSRAASNPWTALSPPPSRPAWTRSVEPGEMPSQVVQYRIQRQLGAGGMGVVYLAEDTVLRRQVALKLMLPAVAAVAGNRERFLREARAMASLSNDHIVTVYQVGQYGDRPFIAMQLLHGLTLEQWLMERGRPPYAEVVRIGQGIATGLAAAHGAGLVHRDIKPPNIWLEEPGGRIKILDFGIARAEGGAGHVTQLGIPLGTPLYMSPEQAAGKPADARSDLFSLGVILYRMCTGQTPFKGDSVLDVLRSIAVETPRPLTDVAPEVPPGLAEIITRLLAKNPAERPASARVTADALAAQAQ